MQVRYRRIFQYGSGSIHLEGEAHATQVSGVATLDACKDTAGVTVELAGNAIRLKSLFEGTSAAKFETLFMLGGRQSIIQALRAQGSTPCIMNDAGSQALYAWIFRKKHVFGKNQTLIMICPSKTSVQAGGWEATERIDLRYGLGSAYTTRYAEVTPSRLADILERMLASKAA